MDSAAVVLPLIGPVEAPGVHVMTCNLRYHDPSVAAGDPDHWPTRREAHRELLRSEHPALIGFQEVLVDQMGDLRDILGDDYLLIGEGREGGDAGEFNPIAIDTARFELLGHEQFWLSPTPEVVGSTGWGASLPRIAVLARLRDRTTGESLTMVNTHLDHLAEQARGGGATLIRRRLAEVVGPVVVTGDMNSPRGAGEAWAAFTSDDGPGEPLVEAWDVAASRVSEDVETFHGYAAGTHDEGRIDWILVRGARVTAVATNAFTVDGAWPSDHYPVQAVLALG